MLTVSEVGKTGKGKFGRSFFRVLLFLFCTPALAANSPHPAASSKDPGTDLGDRLGDCNWQVTYRGRIYDLSPLTRESLSRPIENDIRFAIQRVPEANDRLNSMTSLLRNARAHTMIATAFMGAFALFKYLEINQDNQNQREDYRIASFASGGFFLAATFFSWKSTREAKQELVRAVEAFNAHSPHDILPADGSLAPPAEKNSEHSP